MSVSDSLQSALTERICDEISKNGGWLPFDDFMRFALYAPNLGYYTNGLQKFGASGKTGSDFITAPELSPLFGACIAAQAEQILQLTGTKNIIEFGAGSGALSLQICELFAHDLQGMEQYFIVEISSELRQRQQEKLKKFGSRVVWLDVWPETIEGVVIGNEVLDAMPVKLLHRHNGVWHERGVISTKEGFAWQDRQTDLRPPGEIEGSHDYLTEIHPKAEGFMRSLADRLKLGAVLLIDYGFPESEYYHPQRSMGTLMTHHLHRSDPDPLQLVGLKDITAHVNFTGLAVAAQEDEKTSLDLLGYTTQGRFLMNCGLLQKLELLAHDLPTEKLISLKNNASKLILEHEMGELFKVLALGRLGKDLDSALMGFSQGDRSFAL